MTHTNNQHLANVEVVTPTLKIPQPDGSFLIKAGKPQMIEPDMSVAEAARLLRLSVRWIELQCEQGMFQGAYKPGGRPKSRWRIPRSEVMARRLPPSE